MLELRENQVLVLRLVYLPPKTVTFREVYFALARIGQSKRTARRVIAQLRGLGLIEVVHSVIGIAYPIAHLAANVQRLLNLWQKRRDGSLFPSSVRSFAEVVRLARARKQAALQDRAVGQAVAGNVDAGVGESGVQDDVDASKPGDDRDC